MRKKKEEDEVGSPGEDGESTDKNEEGDEDQGQEDSSSEEILRSGYPSCRKQSYTGIEPSLDPTREGELIKCLVANKSERESLNQKPDQERLRTLVEPAWTLAYAYKPICILFTERKTGTDKSTLVYSDLIVEGMKAVFELACDFDPQQGKIFFDEACTAIQIAINEAFAPEIKYSNIWENKPVEDPPKDEEAKKNDLQWDQVKKYIHRLNKTERKVIRLIYSIGCNPKMKRKEVAIELKKSSQRITIIEKRALRRIQYFIERDQIKMNNKVKWTINDYNSKLRERFLRLLCIPFIYFPRKKKGVVNYIIGLHQIKSQQLRYLRTYLSWFPGQVNGKLPLNYSIGRNLRILLEGQLEIIMVFMPPQEKYNQIHDILGKLKNAGVRIQRLQDLFMTILVGRAAYLRQKYLFREASKRKKKKRARRGFHITKERHSLFSSLLANPKDISNLSKEDITELNKAADEYYGFLQQRLGPPTHDYLYHPFNEFCKTVSKNTLRNRKFWNEVFDLFHLLLPSVVDDNPGALRKHTLPSRRIHFVNWLKENFRKFDRKVQTEPSYTSDGIPYYRMNVPEKYNLLDSLDARYRERHNKDPQ